MQKMMSPVRPREERLTNELAWNIVRAFEDVANGGWWLKEKGGDGGKLPINRRSPESGLHWAWPVTVRPVADEYEMVGVR